MTDVVVMGTSTVTADSEKMLFSMTVTRTSLVIGASGTAEIVLFSVFVSAIVVGLTTSLVSMTVWIFLTVTGVVSSITLVVV